MRILITGGTGYLGQKVIENLLCDENIEILSIVRNKSIESEKEFHHLLKDKRIKTCSNRIEDIEYQLKHGEQVDTILYMACQYNIEGQENEIIRANLMFPLELLFLAVKYNITNYIYIGTSLPKEVNLYAMTKRTFGDYGRYYSNMRKINFSYILLESFYGSDEPGDRFVTRNIKALLNGENLLLTNGFQHRDYIHIDDAVEAMKKIVFAELSGYHEISIGTGEAPTIREMIYYLKDIIGSNSKLCFGAVPERKNEPDCVANIEFLKSLGFKLKYDWKSGLENIVEEMK